MIRVFSALATTRSGGPSTQWMVMVRVDTKVCAYAIPPEMAGNFQGCTHIGEDRHRWNRSTYGFRAMFDQLYTHRAQLKAVFGLDLFSILWWKVDDEANRRGHTSDSVVRLSHLMLSAGELVMPNKIDMTYLVGEFAGGAKVVDGEWEIFPYSFIDPASIQ